MTRTSDAAAAVLVAGLTTAFCCHLGGTRWQRSPGTMAPAEQSALTALDETTSRGEPKTSAAAIWDDVRGGQAPAETAWATPTGLPARRGEGATFINLKMPAPWDNASPTWVLEATATYAIVARHSPGRDVQVVRVDGDRWQYLGKNGRGITGVDGSLLNAAARSPDGRLWIVAERSRFPNQIQGNQFCLYLLENDRWRPVGPRFGAPRKHSWNHDEHGLYFFSDNRPVTVSIRASHHDDRSSWELRLRRLEGDRWATLTGHEYVYDRTAYLACQWRVNDAWLFQARETSGRTTLDVRRIKGPRLEDVAGPFHLDSWAGRMCFFHFAVAADNSIAVVGCNGSIDEIESNTTFFVKRYQSSGAGVYQAKEVPFPPGTGRAIDIMKWSPNSSLHVVRTTDEKISVHRLADDRWILAGEGTEPREFGSTTMSQRLSFRGDGIPIVTWEKFLQVD